MDVVSHALWSAAAGEGLRRRTGQPGRVTWAAAALGVAPDVLSLLPVLVWAAFQANGWEMLGAYVTARPGGEPAMPNTISTATHHFHCISHSVVIAAVVTLVLWRLIPQSLTAVAGWWVHILVDIPTHSSDYYAVPFLYPFTYWGFDGFAWTHPRVIAINALLLIVVWGALFATRKRIME